MNIDWSKQHNGVHQAPFHELSKLMPDIMPILDTFPDNPHDFTWDIKIHMLMPRQYPCIPNWHYDNIPRINGIQRPELSRPELPMYLWISGPPLTQFKWGYLKAGVWHKFNQQDEHRGTPSGDFTWRGFVRATHKDILPPKKEDYLRKHCQIYLDAEEYKW